MNVLQPKPGLLPAMVMLVALVWSGAAVVQARASGADTVLTLDRAVAMALEHDPWMTGNRLAQAGVEAASVAAGSLPDPKLTFGLMNLPTDTFDFNQEPMTQFGVGVSQSFPRGRSAALRRQQLTLSAEQYPLQRQERRARVAATVSELWLQLFQARGSIALIQQNRVLFEQLVGLAMASYASALGRTRQQDVIRAELELTRLADRLSVQQQRADTLAEELAKWLRAGGTGDPAGVALAPVAFRLGPDLPEIPLREPRWVGGEPPAARQALVRYLARHPAIATLDKKIAASGAGVDLAKQKYKPEWGVAASYGYRQNDPGGNPRADFLSIGVSLDLPLFTANRQDREVEAAVAQAEAVKSEKWLALRDLVAAFEAARVQYATLGQRQQLYRERLLPQMEQQAEAALTAYTAGDGDFSEVARARIAELNARIEALAIDVQRQVVGARLNYFLVGAADGAGGDSHGAHQ